MEMNTFKVGMKVALKGDPKAKGIITNIYGASARVLYGSLDSTFAKLENLSDLEQVRKDSPRSCVAELIAHWNVKPTESDLAAIADIVRSAIDDCGLDATMKVEVDKDYGLPTLGYDPYKAVIKIQNAHDTIRIWNGALLKGLDTITVRFSRKIGLYDFQEYRRRQEEERKIFAENPTDKALEMITGLHWDNEVVDFDALTNGKIRGYRCRRWESYTGGIRGYGQDHLGGSFGYADTWENLKVDFSKYLANVANDCGYAGKARRVSAA